MSTTTDNSPESRRASSDPLRVMVIGDSEIVGKRVAAALDKDAGFAIAAHVPDGVAAVSTLRTQVVDAVVIDIGNAAENVKVTLSRLFRVDPSTKVVMIASLTFANVKTSMAGLLAGAAEFIPTPAAHTKMTSEAAFARDLIAVLRAFGRSERTIEMRPVADVTARVRQVRGNLTGSAAPSAPITLRPESGTSPAVIGIGSSTGGPQALFTFIAGLPPDVDIPILITQHMPANFTTLLAGHIAKHCGRDCHEGVDGEAIVPGRVYLAPGDRHMMAVPSRDGANIRLTDDPPINFCRPSVEPLFESLAAIYKARTLCVMLTGMGADGLAGSRAVVEAGGTVIAQDEATSVVWGMPRAVAEAGLCSAVLPLDELASHVAKRVTRQSP